MKCNNCGNELSSVSDEEFERYAIEFFKTFRPIGMLRGLKRIANYWRGHLSDNVCRVEGYYYCKTCKAYKMECSNCGHLIELAREHPFQGNSYKCPICGKTLIFYDENSGDYEVPIDYYP